MSPYPAYEGGHLDHSRIQTQIDVLNQVYSANSMPFRFELTSIDYTTNSFWFQNYGPESPGDVAMRKALRVGGIADLNVDSVGSILSLQGEAFFGLSTFPWDLRTNSSDPSLFKDGIVLDYTVLPGGRPDLNKGWVLVHEVFHFFGGYHLWSGGCDTTTGGDEVSDTNPQAEANHGYPMGRHSCSTQYTDMVWNFMDYTDQSCGDKSFTPGQVARATAFAKLYRGIGSSMTTLDVSRRRKSGRQKGL
ncbi:BQ2448_7901 [Microbotryum intermedium]|uniref:BQ2448_7901 protein n=1 Tax=Microbotryum intermedium TaxID=269621 RepID=A0A238FM90_9BASI|nr:BQ2448_7901 [Microbotryum intermedium]